MKKLLICLVLLVAVSANAQNKFSKGDWFLGAQSTGLGFESRFHDGGSLTLNVGVLGGWFFAPGFAVDAMGGIDYVNERGFQSDGTINFGAGVRYYPVGNLFARLGYNGNVLWSGDVRSYLEAKVGYDIFISGKIFFEPAVYFQKNIDSGSYIGNRWTENVLGLSIGIGVRF